MHVSCYTMLRSAEDTLAERLRRRPAKPMGSARVGSNPTGVELHMASLSYMGNVRIGYGLAEKKNLFKKRLGR